MFLRISQYSQENTCARVSFLIKLQSQAWACNFIKKETLAHVFSCEFCEIFRCSFFYRTPPVAAFELIWSLSQAYDYFQIDKTSHEVEFKFKDANEDNKSIWKYGVTT